MNEHVLERTIVTSVAEAIPGKEKYIEDRIGDFLTELKELNIDRDVDVSLYAEGTYEYELSVILASIINYYKELKTVVYDYYNGLYACEFDDSIRKMIDKDLDVLYDMFFTANINVIISDDIMVTLTLENKLNYLSYLEEM